MPFSSAETLPKKDSRGGGQLQLQLLDLLALLMAQEEQLMDAALASALICCHSARYAAVSWSTTQRLNAG